MVKRLAPGHLVLGAYAGGLCLSLCWQPDSISLLMLGGGCCAAVCLTAMRYAARLRAAPVMGAAAVALTFVLAGVAIGGARVAAVAQSDARRFVDARVSVRGVVLDLPEAGATTVSVPVRLRSIAGHASDDKALLRIDASDSAERAATLLDPCGRYAEGVIVDVISAKVRPLPPPSADGFDYGRYLARRGIHVVLETSLADIRPAGRRGGLLGLTDKLRIAARRSLQRGMPSPQREVLRGMVLGDDENMDEQAVDDFRRSGLLHIMAVSGENVVLLCSLCGAALSAVGLGRRLRLCMLLPVIGAYVILTGAAPSIVRAGVAGAVVTLAGLASRPTDAALLVLAPAAVLLTMNPWNLLDAGFQLSFAAVIGLFCLAGRLRGFFSFLPGPLAEPASVTTAASLATAPVSLASFGQASLVGLIANVAGGFVLGPVMLLGMVSIAVGFVLPEVSTALNLIAGVLISFLLQVAHACARLPFAVYQWHGPTLAFLIAAFILSMLLALQPLALHAGVGVMGYVSAGRRRHVVALAAATLLSLAIVLAPSGPRPPVTPALTILDVGEGAAALLQAPDAPTALVDAGPAPLADVLRRHAVDEIDLLVLSHGHADHTAGLTEVLQGITVRTALLPRPPGPEPALDRLQSELEQRGATVRRCAAPLRYRTSAYELLVLPTQGGESGSNQDQNDWALVVTVTLADERILLPGDCEGEALERVVSGPFAAVELPHHGSSGGVDPDFLQRLAPRLAIVSVGPNRYGHPSTEALEVLAEAGVPLLRTDRSGDISLTASPDGLRVSCEAGGE